MLTFIPVGGLANRMRAIASALTMARLADRRVSVVWFRDWALNAPFNALFEPFGEPDLTLREAALSDLLTVDRPRRRNLMLPALWQRCRYSRRIYERTVTPLCREGFDFAGWAAAPGKGYMASYSDFMTYPDALLARLFRPVAEVRDEVSRRLSAAADGEVVGVHIRRTDNAESIARSPLSLFFDRLDAEVGRDAATHVYLATDSEEVKAEMRRRYGPGRILTAPRAADRSTVGGIRDGIADLYTLAATARIYGSAGSTFSTMAGRLGGIRVEVVATQE